MWQGAAQGVEARRGVTGGGRHGHTALVPGSSPASLRPATQHTPNKRLGSPHHKLGLRYAHVALGLREGLVSVAGHAGVYSGGAAARGGGGGRCSCTTVWKAFTYTHTHTTDIEL